MVLLRLDASQGTTTHLITRDVCSIGDSAQQAGYSVAVQATVIFFSGLAMSNSLELLLMIFMQFSRYKGVYFWSLLVASAGVVPHSVGNILYFLIYPEGAGKWTGLSLIVLGWYCFITGQSLVLWSRLHLVVEPGVLGQRILRWTLWMIIINFIVLQPPTSVVTFGANGSINPEAFAKVYNVYEKIQVAGFCIQELILSTIYIVYAIKLLQASVRPEAKKILFQLLTVNIVIILMDLGLVGMEAASLYLFEVTVKPALYSIKLKLEFVVLGRLIVFVGGKTGSEGDSMDDERWQQAYARFRASMADASSDPKINETFTHAPSMSVSPDEKGTTEVFEIAGMTRAISDAHYSSGLAGLRRMSTTTTTPGPQMNQRKSKSSAISAGRGVTEEDIDFARFQYDVNAHSLEHD